MRPTEGEEELLADIERSLPRKPRKSHKGAWMMIAAIAAIGVIVATASPKKSAAPRTTTATITPVTSKAAKRRAAARDAASVAAIEATLAAAPPTPSPGIGDTYTSPDQSTTISVREASTYFRQQVAGHYGGPVSTSDGRGCIRTSSARFSCVGYVRPGGGLSSGLDVAGTVTMSADGSSMTASAHQASNAEIQRWFAKTGGTGVNY